jgi:hypothetical protein
MDDFMKEDAVKFSISMSPFLKSNCFEDSKKVYDYFKIQNMFKKKK